MRSQVNSLPHGISVLRTTNRDTEGVLQNNNTSSNEGKDAGEESVEVKKDTTVYIKSNNLC
ncbi:MAG: hypothetical protein JNL60_07935 [Bacteroidia bacterium]|nr:hypothetical protein [Bacteroidia bacterium]